MVLYLFWADDRFRTVTAVFTVTGTVTDVRLLRMAAAVAAPVEDTRSRIANAACWLAALAMAMAAVTRDAAETLDDRMEARVCASDAAMRVAVRFVAATVSSFVRSTAPRSVSSRATSRSMAAAISAREALMASRTPLMFVWKAMPSADRSLLRVAIC